MNGRNLTSFVTCRVVNLLSQIGKQDKIDADMDLNHVLRKYKYIHGYTICYHPIFIITTSFVGHHIQKSVRK